MSKNLDWTDQYFNTLWFLDGDFFTFKEKNKKLISMICSIAVKLFQENKI